MTAGRRHLDPNYLSDRADPTLSVPTSSAEPRPRYETFSNFPDYDPNYEFSNQNYELSNQTTTGQTVVAHRWHRSVTERTRVLWSGGYLARTDPNPFGPELI